MADSKPLSRLKFMVEFGGESTSFQEVVLPESEIEVTEYRDGSDVTSSVRKFPGLVKYSNLVLKRGMTKSQDPYDWFKQTKQGRIERRDIAVSILNEENEPVAIWKMKNCWPTKYSGSTLKAGDSGIVVEALEIATEEVDVEIN